MGNELKIVLKAVDSGAEGSIKQAVARTDRPTDAVQRAGHYAAGLARVNVAIGWAKEAADITDAFTTLESG